MASAAPKASATLHRALAQQPRPARRIRAHADALKACRLAGVGSSVPETALSNDDLSAFVDTSDEWIAARTGIRKRHVVAQGETITQHATASAKAAMEMAGLEGADVDMVIVATSSPDDVFGSATQVQDAIGAKAAIAFDITAACSGFVVALLTAAQFVRTGARKNVVIVGADALSRYVDWTDRGTCILFGDGAGAAVLTAHDGPCALLGSDMSSDGAGYCELNSPMPTDAGGKASDAERRGAHTAFQNIHMNGGEVYKFAVRTVPRTLKASLAQAGMEGSELDWLVMHQANQRILDAVAKKLSLPGERVVSNLAEYGNTSAASIPIALDEAVRGGSVQRGQVLGLAGFGAGLTWASAIVRWQ